MEKPKIWGNINIHFQITSVSRAHLPTTWGRSPPSFMRIPGQKSHRVNIRHQPSLCYVLIRQLDAVPPARCLGHKDTRLRYCHTKKPVAIQINASGKGIGAVHIQDNGPITFASKALTPTEQCETKRGNYSAEPG